MGTKRTAHVKESITLFSIPKVKPELGSVTIYFSSFPFYDGLPYYDDVNYYFNLLSYISIKQ